jgi:acyl-CoA synthetase (AMP-forming)/AMP-acid ligase II
MTDIVSHTSLSPLSFLRRAAEVYPNKTAVVHGDRRFTYGELAKRVRHAAGALRAAGVQPGDRVAYLCPNVPALLEAHFAVPLAEAVLVAINIRLSPREIAHILDHSGAKVLVADTEIAAPLAPLRAERRALRAVVNVRETPAPDPFEGEEYETFLRRGAPLDLTSVPADETALLSINYTSGTTGLPKGVMYTHRGAYLNALGLGLEVKLDADATYLWTLPMFHCNGWCFPWAITAVGGTHLCLRKVEPPVVFEMIERYSVSHLCAAPTVLIGLAHHPRAARLQLARPLTIATGGAPPAPQVIRNVEAFGARLVHLYGLTETYGPHTFCEWQPEWNEESDEARARLKARQGVAGITALDVRVVGEQMCDVPRDGATLGEIVMRGNNVMAGYYRDPEATATAFRGGWFHSGDIAVMHPDGYIEIRDRKKDVIISGGENISTVEVESVIYQHPAVMEVAVVGIPDEKWGEVPKAFVTLKSTANASSQDIIEFCRERMAHFKCPKAVAFGDLPKTSTGKIQKFVLRDREWQGKEKKVN